MLVLFAVDCQFLATHKLSRHVISSNAVAKNSIVEVSVACPCIYSWVDAASSLSWPCKRRVAKRHAVPGEDSMFSGVAAGTNKSAQLKQPSGRLLHGCTTITN